MSRAAELPGRPRSPPGRSCLRFRRFISSSLSSEADEFALLRDDPSLGRCLVDGGQGPSGEAADAGRSRRRWRGSGGQRQRGPAAARLWQGAFVGASSWPRRPPQRPTPGSARSCTRRAGLRWSRPPAAPAWCQRRPPAGRRGSGRALRAGPADDHLGPGTPTDSAMATCTSAPVTGSTATRPPERQHVVEPDIRLPGELRQRGGVLTGEHRQRRHHALDVDASRPQLGLHLVERQRRGQRHRLARSRPRRRRTWVPRRH